MNFFQWLWTHPVFIPVLYITVMTLACFFAMGADKRRARKNQRRIREATLFLLAVLGGSIGGILGTYAFNHKTRHKAFTIGFPVVLVLQIAVAALIVVLVNQ